MSDPTERHPNGRQPPRRVPASLAVACGVHSMLLFAVWMGQVSRPAKSDAEERILAGDELQWDLDLVEPPSDTPVQDEGPAAHALGALRNAPAAIARHATEPNAPPSPEPAAPASTEEPWTFSPFAQAPVDFAHGPARAAQLGALASESKLAGAADERPSKLGGLAEALDAEDVKRGMGRGGPVKLAVEEAVRSTDAPTTGTATFDIAVETSGELQVRVVTVSSEFERWNRLIAAIRTGLARKRVSIPPGARGLHVVVEVEAHEQFPDGTSPASLGATLTVAPDAPLTNGELPVRARYRGKVCETEPTVILQQLETVGAYRPPVYPMFGLKGRCTPENAGVPARRVVSSRIIKETRF